MWMGRASSPSSRGERKTSNLWCPSAILAQGCPRSRRTRSSMRSLPRRFMGPVWDCPSAAPSLNRIAAACGLPTTLHAAQVFTSFYPPKSRSMNDVPSERGRSLRQLDAALANDVTPFRALRLYVGIERGLALRQHFEAEDTVLVRHVGSLQHCDDLLFHPLKVVGGHAS